MPRNHEKAELLDKIFDYLYIKTSNELKLLLVELKQDAKEKRNQTEES